ncbi:MAG: hypothetical protein MI919_03580 [Holophagales bacterium]|nr:hypothetical protein [Holophagales bacterium]
MTITLQLSADQERRFEESAARRDVELMREILRQALDSWVESLLDTRQQAASGPRRARLAKLAAELPDLPALSDEAVSRSGIYGDHP